MQPATKDGKLLAAIHWWSSVSHGFVATLLARRVSEWFFTNYHSLAGRAGVTEGDLIMKFGIVTYMWGADWDLPTLIKNCEATGF